MIGVFSQRFMDMTPSGFYRYICLRIYTPYLFLHLVCVVFRSVYFHFTFRLIVFFSLLVQSHSSITITHAFARPRQIRSTDSFSLLFKSDQRMITTAELEIIRSEYFCYITIAVLDRRAM